MDIRKAIQDIIRKYQELSDKISDFSSLDHSQMAQLSKEKYDLEGIYESGIKYLKILDEVESLNQMLKDSSIDQDLKEMATHDLSDLNKVIPDLELQIKIMLLPKNQNDKRNAILEIRAGVGGDEAALFGLEVTKMYQRYADRNGWKFEEISSSYTEGGGIKELIVSLSGKDVFSRMKFESGTHRVQRIPATENNGRVHTSTVTVAVLPEMEEFEVKINQKDIRIDLFRSSGPGGQSVNTTESAVRITHIPTGIVVSQQDEKSQIKNREKAMKVLRMRVYEHEQSQIKENLAKERKDQIGTGDRSEKIRTYNYPQNRVTDHRVGVTIHSISKVINEGDLDQIIDTLISEDELRRLSEQ